MNSLKKLNKIKVMNQNKFTKFVKIKDMINKYEEEFLKSDIYFHLN